MKYQAAYIQLNNPNCPSGNTTIKRVGNYTIAAWGDDNNYPLFLNYLKTKCALHNGILEGKIRQLYKHISKFAGKANVNGTSNHTLNELIQRLLVDFEVKNAFAIKIKKILNTITFDYVNIDHVRASESGEYYYICSDWTKPNKSNISILPNFFNTKESESVAVYMPAQCNYFDALKNKMIYNYYPLPTYAGAIEAILTDIKISHFHHSEITNGFLLGAIVNFANGIPETDDEKREIVNEFREKVKDRDKQGGILVTFSNGKETAPEVTPLNGNDLDTRYLMLSKDVQERIITSHGVTSPLLFGIKTAGQLGGATELEQANELFKENYVMPRLQIFTEFVNQVLINKVAVQMSKTCCSHGISEDDIVNLFENSGIDKTKVELIGDTYEFDADSEELLNKYTQFSDTRLLTALQDKVLSLLISGESVTKITELLNIDVKKVYDVMQQLQAMKLLDDDFAPTKTASNALKEKVLAVFYEYRVRPNLGSPIIDTTRPFCRKLIELNKVYTRQDIDKISNKVGRDVWYYRGGWYRDPKEEKNYPYCRHYWYQQVGIVDKTLI